MELHINGHPVDLAPDAVIAVTVQSNDITKPDTVQSSYSNTLTLPFTERNHAVMGSSNQVTSLSDVPYSKLDCSLTQEGVEVLPLPKAYLTQASEGYELDIFSGALDFFAKLGDKSIQDLDLSRYNHEWSLPSVVAGCDPARGYAEGYAYDLIYRGKDMSLHQVYAWDLYPSVFVRAVYAQLMQEAGVNWQLDNPLFDKLILPFSNGQPKHTDAWVNARVYELEEISQFGAPYLEYGTLEVEHTFTVTALPNGASTIFVNLLSTASQTISYNIGRVNISNPGTYTVKGSIAIDRINYNLSDLYIKAGNDATPVTRSGLKWKLSYKPDAVYGGEWDVACNLPEIKQKDFFKMVNALLGLMPSFDVYSNTVKLTPMQVLEENKAIAKDWSDKLVDADRVPVQYRFGEFAQKSWFRYLQEDVPVAGSDAYLTIADTQLPEEEDILELPVASCAEENSSLSIPTFTEEYEEITEYERQVDTLAALSTLSLEGLGEVVKVLNAEGVHAYANIERRFVHKGAATYIRQAGHWRKLAQEVTYLLNDSSPRLAIYNGNGRAEITLREYGTNGTTVLIARPSFKGLEFSTLLATYYQVLQGILTHCKGITPSFLLNARDVQEYDPSIPIWLEQYQHYFYLNSIEEYTGTGPTTCQLWRL
jgi:hypothetical protein